MPNGLHVRVLENYLGFKLKFHNSFCSYSLEQAAKKLKLHEQLSVRVKHDSNTQFDSDKHL